MPYGAEFITCSQCRGRLVRFCTTTSSLLLSTQTEGWVSLQMFLNIMFHAPMERFQLESKFELPLFSGFTGIPFN